MPVTLLMLPPQDDKTRDWGSRIAAAHPELEVVVAETREGAEQAMPLAEAAYGTIPPDLLNWENSSIIISFIPNSARRLPARGATKCAAAIVWRRGCRRSYPTSSSARRHPRRSWLPRAQFRGVLETSRLRKSAIA